MMIFLIMNCVAVGIVSLMALINQWAKFCVDRNWDVLIYISGIIFLIANVSGLIISLMHKNF